MAILQRTSAVDTDRSEELTHRLLIEWQAPHDGVDEPLIVLEAPAAGATPNHVYVIWQEWSDLAPTIRSRVILKAYETIYGADVVNVTIAMGLTKSEADDIGLKLT